MNIKLVNAKPENYYEVDKLMLNLHNKHATVHPNYYNKLDFFNNQEEYNNFINQESNIIVLAKQSGKIIGLLWAEMKEKFENRYIKNRRELWLEGIVVDEEYKNLGIGKILMEELIDIGKKGDFDSIELMVWSGNDEAINLYNKYFKQRAKIMTYCL